MNTVKIFAQNNLHLWVHAAFMLFWFHSVASNYPPVSKGSRKVANLAERKENCICYQRICLSVLVNFYPNYLWTSITECAIFLHLWQNELQSNFNTKTATQTCTIHRGVWNLPHNFHLFLIIIIIIILLVSHLRLN